jgi:tRNA A37 threonylcarbamoyladenosine dehydratase
MDLKYQRCATLFGDDYPPLFDKKILLLGVGGVGSFALDCLYRTGVRDITIVDFDRYDETNQNRQLGSEAVGCVKVQHLKTLYPDVTPIHQKINQGWVDDFDFGPYDLVLDAIDDIRAKVALIKKVHKKLIVSTGSAKRTDPTMIKVDSLWRSKGDKLAAKLRYELRQEKFSKRVTVIYSDEVPKCKEKGSFVGVTGAFGLTMCSQAINFLLKS